MQSRSLDIDSLPPIDRSSIEKDRTIRRRQTIDTVRTRDHASRRRQQQQTPLKQLQTLFKPDRQTQTTTIINDDDELEMLNKDQTSSSVREKRKRDHHHQNSDV